MKEIVVYMENEWVEKKCRNLSDQAYKDILDYCVGMYLTILVMVGMMI